MGLIRGGLLVIVFVLLFLSFLVGNTLFTLSLSLDYDAVKSELVRIADDFNGEEFDLNQKVDEIYPSMVLYCENNLEYVFSEQGNTFVVPCEVVFKGSDAVVDFGINSFIEGFYYKEYNCDFWNCFEETGESFFLVSQKAQDYWRGKFYLSILISIVLTCVTLVLIENRTTLPIIVGSLLSISALPFMKLNWLFSLTDNSLFDFLTGFFSKSYTVFLISFILGLILIALGIVLKFFVVGFKISDLFSRKDKGVSKKEIKSIVKEEIFKGKNKSKK
ncbi:MAG: hypothetical protein ABH811_02220 [archaeon]